MSDEAKGARRKALDLMEKLKEFNTVVVVATIELENAKRQMAYVTRERDIVADELTDLINRCMESFVADELTDLINRCDEGK